MLGAIMPTDDTMARISLHARFERIWWPLARLCACLGLVVALSPIGWAAPAAVPATFVPPPADPARLDASLAKLAQAVLADASPGAAALTQAQRSQALIVAGQHADAAVAVEALMASFVAQDDPGRAQRWVPYLLLAQAQASARGDVGSAYAAAFRRRFALLDDLAALQTHYWFVANVDAATQQLAQAVAQHAPDKVLPREVALDLLRQAAFVQTFRVAVALAPSLISEDQDRRFTVDDQVMIPGADGVMLSAHLARRRGVDAPLPAAMQLTIYTDPARNRSDALLAAAHGYAGVVVDARGKRLGTGEAAPYETEGRDAHAAIDWISRQPWNDGRVVMYGGSYLGFAAWAAAKYRHPALKAIAAYVAAIPGLGLPMENNVFLTANYAWPFYVANNRLLDDDTYNQRGRWSALAEKWYASGQPYRQIDQVDGTPNPWLQRWLSHPAYDAYWQAMVPYGDDFAGIDIPVLSVTGYYDDGQISALQYFKEHYRHRPDADHTLLIGPYDHFGAQSPVKAMQLRGYDVDKAAQFDTQALTFEWFDHVLKGAPRPALLAGRVNYQLMGADRWGHEESLAAAAGAYPSFHLSTGSEGPYHRLSRTAPAQGGFLSQVVDFSDRGTERHGYYPDPILRDTLETGDALAFASEVFEQPVDVVGTFSGELKVRINKRDVDLTVTLYEQMQDGRVMQLSYFMGRASHARDMTTRALLQPGRWTVLPFERTRMTARRLSAGSRLLLVVDVLKDANHQVNHGTGRDVSDESVADAGTPLRIDWHTDSVVRIPLQAAR
ncbi:hypothetical protein GCM10027214_34610 [Stenotrophomonas tumulicola]